MKFFPANKTLFGFCISIFLILFIGVSSHLSIRLYDTNSFWVNHTYEVINNIDALDRELLTVESSGRAYILSGDDRFLTPFTGSAQRAEYLLDHLRDLTIDNFTETERIDSLRPLLSERIQDARKKVQIRQKGTTLDVIQQTDMESTRELTITINGLLDEMRHEERRLLSFRNKDMANSQRYADYADWGGTLISLVVVLTLLWYITRLFNEQKIAEEQLRQSNTALEKASAENLRRNWILAGANALNAGLRGEMTLEELGQKVISELCVYMGIQAGAIYIMDTSTGPLRLHGSYAVGGSSGAKEKVELREGLVGQAAYDGKIQILSDVPRDFVRIQSGLGQMVPRQVVDLPLIHDASVNGVLELMSAEPFTGDMVEFLQFIARDIGVSIHTTQSRDRVNALNDQLLEQAEALQLQQEELQASNEELVRQSELLQSSEEELKTQQEELLQTNAELEEKAIQLKENNDALEMARLEVMNKASEVERNSRYKSEFLANMSHELRTPLNSILILAKLLSDNKAANLSDKQVEYSSVIYRSGQDLLNLINDVLDLSKIESGKTTIQVEEVLLSTIKVDIVSLFREVAAARKITFTAQIEPHCPPALYTDKDRVGQILRNLLSNAFKFTHEGGTVRLEVEQVNPRTVALRSKHLLNSSHVLAFHVSDNGMGIPVNKQDVIFEAFQQADGSTNRKFGGTGLGLSISRQLATMLDGELRLESTEGEGSTFTLYLPVRLRKESNGTAPAEAALSRMPAPRPEQRVPDGNNKGLQVTAEGLPDNHEALLESKKIVMIVEDDLVFAGILRDIALDKGFDTIVTGWGDKALHYAKLYSPVAILLDIQLPIMDGWSVLQRLKADPVTRKIPVHIVSGLETQEKGLELGAISFLNKPLTTQDLDHVFDTISGYEYPSLKKVLIVEDDAVQQEYLDRMISEKQKDIICVTAESGEQAIKRISEDVYDCIILDLTLPDMSGYTLLDHLEKTGLASRTKVIVYTSRDIAKEDEWRLRQFTDTIVIKNGRSHERLMDEVALFLNKVEEKTSLTAGVPFWAGPEGDILRGKKVLLVDDDMRNVFALSATLQTQGLEIIVAGDGKEGLQKLSDNPGTDIVLMDIMMPEMDGYEAMTRIRENKRWDKLPILALTAKAMKDDREKCIEAGASDYITKPVDTDQLLSLMRVWLYNSL